MLTNELQIINGQQPGPTVAIIGGLHGNERQGVAVLETLHNTLSPAEIRGRLILILGNPAAYQINHRFVDTDLNRLFNNQLIQLQSRPQITLNTEQRRALELAAILDTVDYALDIHSTLKPSVPFVYCASRPQHLALARLFEVPYIVSAAPGFSPIELTSATDDYVTNQGGIGITFETGWHQDWTTLNHTIDQVKRYLQAVHLLSGVPTKPQQPAESVLIYDHIIPHTARFHFTSPWNNFQKITNGTVLAEDEQTSYCASQDSLIIFPKAQPVIGQSAGYLATQSLT